MKVLRKNHEAILTVVEVFIHDPLYRWTLSPLKAVNIQRDDSETGNNGHVINLVGEEGFRNKEAERTLLRVKQKLLQSTEGEVLSVEGQVEMLINEARSTERLARMFPGWAPWV